MSRGLTDEVEWSRALRLEERLARPGRGESAYDPERAARREERWRSQSPFEAGDRFERRLASAGLDPETLRRLLGESDHDLRQRLPEAPAWLRRLDDGWATPPAAAGLAWPERPDGHPAAFLNLVEPLVRDARDHLRHAVAELVANGGAPFDAATAEELFFGQLVDRLRGLVTRTLVLELQVARLEGTLAGETPEARFQDFLDRLRRPETALPLLRRYPVLARQAVERADAWVETSREFLQRLTADFDAIRRRFFAGDDPGPLVATGGGVSDPHRGGRTVLLLRFASGRRLVYKPKPLAVDVAFQRLLAWIDERGFEPAFRRLEVLDRGEYGWVEFVEPAPCADAGELRRFYRRQGAYLALLHVLDGTDFHQENLIAAGEHPVLVDLETLFHPRVDVRDLDTIPPLNDSARDSVLKIGLLPQRVWGDDEHAGIDLSGLGSSAGQETKPFWGPVGEGTDDMRFARRSQTMLPTENRPRLGDEEARASEHVADVERGFADMYRLLLAERAALTADDGPLAAFAECDVRVVFRPTRGYAMLLLESFHPYVLRDALDRARFLDRLWGGVPHRPFLERVIPAEQADLERADIPLFTTRPGSRDLWTSRGERLEDFFPETGLERLGRRLRALSEDDLARQRFIVRGALHIENLEQGTLGRHSYSFHEGCEATSASDLLAVARTAGDDLARLAFRHENEARWLSARALGPGRWSLDPIYPDLYQGLPGIALFLGFLAELTGEPAHAELARAALATQRRQLEEAPAFLTDVGGFNGWGGLIYAATHLGRLWDDPALLVEAEGWAERLAERIDDDESHDLVAGSAGALLSLLGLHRLRPSDVVWRAALACGEHLLAHARPMDVGLGWVMKVAGPRPLAGLSHGAAGIALALLELAAATGDERFRRAALGGIAYERSLYDPEKRNWPDLRDGAAELARTHGEHFMCGWCHGAPGIGLARVAGLPLLDDAEVREEIAIGVETTLAEGFGDNHSLCHGDLGNLDVLLTTALATGDERLRDRTYRIAQGVLRSIEEHGWLYGLARGAEPLGLMVGLAGIGYGLLRLAAPDRVPCVLTLAAVQKRDIECEPAGREGRHSMNPLHRRKENEEEGHHPCVA